MFGYKQSMLMLISIKCSGRFLRHKKCTSYFKFIAILKIQDNLNTEQMVTNENITLCNEIEAIIPTALTTK